MTKFININNKNIDNYAIYWDCVLKLNYKCKFNGLSQNTNDCCICLDSLKDTYEIILPCGCSYHRDCFYKNMFDHKRNHCAVSKCSTSKIKFDDEVKTLNDFFNEKINE